MMDATTKKRIDQDLWIIVILSVLALAIYMTFNTQLMSIANDRSINILLRVSLFALIQFGVAGLGISVVSLLRKESFISHGLKKEKALPAILFSVLFFLPYIIFSLLSGQLTSYLPFQTAHTTGEVLASPFPTNVIGMLITAIAWGFFEGFNYVVISDKINALYPANNRWLNWGAISCAILCILIHGAIGITPSALIEMFCIMFLIYGMLMVKEKTGNAWGVVFVFVFMWNAFK